MNDVIISDGVLHHDVIISGEMLHDVNTSDELHESSLAHRPCLL